MSDFIPPFPERHKQKLGPLDMLKYARRDLLSIWSEDTFSKQFMSTKIINRSIFIANCPEVVRHVLVTHQDIYQRKSPLLRKALEPLLGNSIFISDGVVWQQHRTVETPLFNHEQVSRYAGIMIKSAEEYAQRWATRKPGSIIQVLPEMGRLAADISCRSLFGDQFGAEQVKQLVEDFAEYRSAIEQMDVSAFFGLPGWMPNLKMGKAVKAAKRIHNLVDNAIAQSSGQETIMTSLLGRRGGENGNAGMTAVEIRNELIALFMGNYEATASTLAWAWYLISQCPEIEHRLYQEADAVLGSDSVSFDDFAKLIFTRAIIEETMRLYPPVPILWREAAVDDTVRNRHVPSGSSMLVVPWLLHRHKLYWNKPDHFMPERFLPGAADKPDEFSYIPFGAGPRVCIGKFFGMVEITLCLAILARRFRLTLPEGQAVTHECRLILRPKDNLPMQLTMR